MQDSRNQGEWQELEGVLVRALNTVELFGVQGSVRLRLFSVCYEACQTRAVATIKAMNANSPWGYSILARPRALPTRAVCQTSRKAIDSTEAAV